MEAGDILSGIDSGEYGDSYRDHVIEIYKIYVEMADRISSRRERANSYFLTINTALVGLVSYLSLSDAGCPFVFTHIPVSIAGIALSYLWYRILKSFRDLNSAKFRVIHEIENYLPLAPYGAEWEVVGRGKDKKLYLPFTHIEKIVPWIFISLHSFVILRVLFY